VSRPGGIGPYPVHVLGPVGRNFAAETFAASQGKRLLDRPARAAVERLRQRMAPGVSSYARVQMRDAPCITGRSAHAISVALWRRFLYKRSYPYFMQVVSNLDGAGGSGHACHRVPATSRPARFAY